jgi:DNA-binding NtrC family response regulator
VVSLHLTPLRQRPGDILLLVEHFLAKYGERYTRDPAPLSSGTLAAMQAWEWPGNVRELENTVNQIVLLGEKSFLSPARPGAPVKSTAAALPVGTPLKEGLESVIEQFERRTITESLARNEGNKSRTARELCVTRKTLAQKIAKYGLSQ